MHNSLLIENGTVVTGGQTPTVLQGHSVLIEGGYITQIAPKKQVRPFSGKRIDAAGRIVMPGLINAHSHFYSTFACGLTKARPSSNFLEVLENLWWSLDSALTTEDCYYSALIPLLQSIRHGTTTLIDHHASPNAVRGSLTTIEKAVKETGLRACLCYELSDRDGARISKQGVEENVSFILHCQRKRREKATRASAPQQPSSPRPGETGRGRDAQPAAHSTPPNPSPEPWLAALFGLHAAFTLKNATLTKAAALGHELGAGFHIHVAEAQSDQDSSLANHGMRVVERLHKFGILGPRSIAAHCVHVNGKEMGILSKTQTAVVHNAQSNLNNAVGIADIISLTKKGILVGLGTDAMTTNMLEELRVALWSQHIRARNPSVGFGEVVSTLVANNPRIAGRVFNLPLGQLAEGSVGDVVVVDYNPPTPMENFNIFGHLVFGISQAAVDTTVVAGRVLMQNRKLTLNIDEERIHARAREQAAKLWKRL